VRRAGRALLESVSPERRAELQADLETADELFRRVTREVGAPVNEQEGAGWWWFRVPLRPGEELAWDLEQMGVAAPRD
jgi:hypothetical protein